MDSAMLEQVNIQAFDLDHADVQQKLVRIHGRVMTIDDLRHALVPKTRKVRQEAVAMRHLYDAISAEDKEKTASVFERLLPTLGVQEIRERLHFHMLLERFYALMGSNAL